MDFQFFQFLISWTVFQSLFLNHITCLPLWYLCKGKFLENKWTSYMKGYTNFIIGWVLQNCTLGKVVPVYTQATEEMLIFPSLIVKYWPHCTFFDHFYVFPSSFCPLYFPFPKIIRILARVFFQDSLVLLFIFRSFIYFAVRKRYSTFLATTNS